MTETTPPSSGSAFGIIDPGQDAGPLNPATFNIAEWVAGLRPALRAVKLYQRPDLMQDVDRLRAELRVAEAIPHGDRALGDDRPPSVVEQELFDVAQRFEASAAWFVVRGLSDTARDVAVEQAKAVHLAASGKPTADAGEPSDLLVTRHTLAAAITEPAGVTPAVLEAIEEASPAQIKLLLTAYGMVANQAPRVDVPSSPASSAQQRGRGR